MNSLVGWALATMPDICRSQDRKSKSCRQSWLFGIFFLKDFPVKQLFAPESALISAFSPRDPEVYGKIESLHPEKNARRTCCDPEIRLARRSDLVFNIVNVRKSHPHIRDEEAPGHEDRFVLEDPKCGLSLHEGSSDGGEDCLARRRRGDEAKDLGFEKILYPDRARDAREPLLPSESSARYVLNGH